MNFKYAPLYKRIFATLIDLIIFLFITWIPVITISEFIMGKTLGKRLLKIQVVRTNQSKLTLSNSLLRHIIDPIDIVLLIGPILILTTKNKQRLGDMIAKTYVISIV